MGGPGSGRYPRKKKSELEKKLARYPRYQGKGAAARSLSGLLKDNPEELEGMSREDLMKLALDDNEDDFQPATFRTITADDIDPLPPQPKGGRPHKFSVARVQIILNAITSGMPADYAAVEAGIDEATFYDWMNRHPLFAALVFEAQAARFRHYMTHIAKAAPNNPIAAAIVLERLDPKHFGRKDKVEHTMQVQGGVNIQHILIDPRNIELVSELEQRLQSGDVIEGEARELTALPEHLEGEQ
jgi:hypothetical protein